jgi:histidinol-phosphate aminotransferase
MSTVRHLVRPQVLAIQPYDLPPAGEGIRLNANESAWRSDNDRYSRGLNRYPDAYPQSLAAMLAGLYRVDPGQLVLTRGSDEAIDLLIRLFCREGVDEIIICPPTFGMYKVYAQVQGAGVTEVPLDAATGFGLDADRVLGACGVNTRLVFLCSPNNPTGQLLDEQAVLGLAQALLGRAVVVVDEAYVEFADRPSLIGKLGNLPNLVVLRTLSKAYALAGARLGAMVASSEIAGYLRRIVPPYALATPVLEAAEAMLDTRSLKILEDHMEQVRQLKDELAAHLATIRTVRKVWPSDANFLLVELDNAARVSAALESRGILVRDFSQHPDLRDCLRLTVGTPDEQSALLACIREQANG